MAILNKQTNIALVLTITFITVLVAVFVFLIDSIYDHQKELFGFGPSKNLLFLGIPIDTTAKYVGLILFMIFLEVLDLCQEEYIDPFIHMIMNANDSSNRKDLRPYTWFQLYYINHFSLAAQGLRNILHIVLITTQVPLAMLIWLCKEIIRSIFIVKVTNNWYRMNGTEMTKMPIRESRF